MTAWVKTNSVPQTSGDGGKVIWKGLGSAPWLSWALQVNGAKNGYIFQVSDGSAAAVTAGSTPMDAAGEWQFLAGTYDGANLKLYDNSVLVNTTPFALGIGYFGNFSLSIGGNNTYAPQTFDGLIDEVRFYNRALNDDEILALYLTSSLCPM